MGRADLAHRLSTIQLIALAGNDRCIRVMVSPQLDLQGTSMAKLRFGYFIAPFHRAGTNPTLALQRDLEFIEHSTRSASTKCGWASITRPAARSSAHRRSSSALHRSAPSESGLYGVTSLSYHNPLWVADRLMLLDHLTHGRVIGGVGPGSLPSDSAMIGLTPTDTRELLETNLDIVVRLLAGRR